MLTRIADGVEYSLAFLCVATGGYAVILWLATLLNWGSAAHMASAMLWTLLAVFAVALMAGVETVRGE
jgi:hypothetical protein